MKDIAKVVEQKFESKTGAEALPPDYDIVDLNQKYKHLEADIASIKDQLNKHEAKTSTEKPNVYLLAHSVDFQSFGSAQPYRFIFKIIEANKGNYLSPQVLR